MGDDTTRQGRQERRSQRGETSTRRTFLKAASAGIGGIALGATAGTAGASSHTPRLHTDGRWVRDPDGNPVTLRGVSTAGLDFLQQDHPRSVEDVLGHATNDDWHTDVIRLPVTEWPVHEQGVDHVVGLLRSAVDFLADQGVYAAIDFHLIRPYVETQANAEGMVADGWASTLDDLGFQHDVPTDDLLREFWGAVAPEFADDEHVLFELFNEPTLPNSWSTYGEAANDVNSREDSWLLWRDTAQPWVDLIRQHAPETPIIVGSPDWTSETQFAPAYPFDGENLIYSGHIYPDNGQPSEFDSEYGEPANDVPVIISEFGWDPDEEFSENVEYGTTSGWGQPFREWADSYENMGWFGWCFDDSWAPTYFDSPGEGAGEPWTLKTGAEQQGEFMQQWLEDMADEDPDDGGDGGDGGDGDGGDGGDGTDPGDGDAIADGATFRVENANSGLVLEVENGSTSDGANVQQGTDEGGAHQQWTTVANGDGSYRLENANSGQVADVEYASTSDGANVLQWPDNGGVNQHWNAIANDGGGYTFESVNSGLVLEVANGSQAGGANVQQGTDEGGAHQQWVLVQVDGGGDDGGDGGDGDDGDDGGDEDTTAPAPPSNLTSSNVTESSVDLDWSAPGDDDVASYTVSVDGSADHEVSAGTTATTVSGLAADTSYDVSVTAVDDAGNESDPSETVSVTTDSDDSGGDDGDGDGGDGGDDTGDHLAEMNPSTTSASVGEGITFTVEDTSGESNWIDGLAWDFDDGTTASGWWVSHSFDATGNYDVTLTATDNEGNSTVHEVTITVS